MFLKEYTLSKTWLITNLLYGIYNRVDRIPIFIKSSVTPCRDTFWDAHMEWVTPKVVSINIYYRDGQTFDKIDTDGLFNEINFNSDINVLKSNVGEYVEKLGVICFEKFGIRVVE